jgi:hypothetical protein
MALPFYRTMMSAPAVPEGDPDAQALARIVVSFRRARVLSDFLTRRLVLLLKAWLLGCAAEEELGLGMRVHVA